MQQAAAGNAAGSAVYVDDVFSTFVYEGRGGASGLRTIDNGIDLAGEAGLIWTRERDNAAEHLLIDTERGLSGGYLSSDSNSAANTGRVANSIDSFTSTGYKLDGGGSLWDRGSYKYVSWTFRKQEKFFDIVTFEAPSSADDDYRVSHNLGSVPGMIIVKSVDASGDWYVWHRSFGNRNDSVKLNSSNASAGSGDFWGESDPTATDFGVQVRNFATRPVTTGAGTYVAYLFAHDEQEFGEDSDEAIIKCGSYTGNGNTDGPTVTLGFEPQWLMIRGTGGGDWQILDNMRGINSGGTNDARLLANTSAAEYNSIEAVQLQATGFKIDGTTGGAFNGSGSNYIYVAIRRPNKPASELAATDLFGVNSYSETNDYQQLTTGNLVDLGWHYLNGDGAKFFTRLLGKGYLNPTSRAVANTSAASAFDFMDGFEPHYANNVSGYSPRLVYGFRRAPGFFDVVTYTGAGSAVWHNHNLGVVPEMIWFKGRDIAEYWNVFTTGGGTSGRLHLDEGSEYITNNANQFFPSLPTATQFRIGGNNEIGGSGYNYIAYLFASVDGISKLGTYTGTGSAQDIDCGFSAGARFVLIKRVDVAGFWILFDSLRGIVAGNDPYLFLNTTAAQTTNTDYIDPLSSGFTITSSAPANNADNSMNKSGGTYFFYAIA
jgi:hypothetical protein